METLYRRTRLAPPPWAVPTFRRWKPRRALDHILTSLPVNERAPHAPPVACSDHLAATLSVRVPAQMLQGDHSD